MSVNTIIDTAPGARLFATPTAAQNRLRASRRKARPKRPPHRYSSGGHPSQARAAPVKKKAILPADLREMLATLPHDLRVLRDCAILLIGFGGGLRRSEIVSLDRGKDDTPANRQLHRN